MPPIVSFIGWHNSGKTTLARQVVTQLKNKGYRVGVIKSTKDTAINQEQPETDTARYQQAGADMVALAAPDQVLLRTWPSLSNPLLLAGSLFSTMDIVIAEGFKNVPDLEKIEVRRDPQASPLLGQVPGVIAVATDQSLEGTLTFQLDQSHTIADYIEERFIAGQVRQAEGFTLSSKGRLMDRLSARTRTLMAELVDSLAVDLQKQSPSGPVELTIRREEPSPVELSTPARQEQT